MALIRNIIGEGFHPLSEPLEGGRERDHDIGPVSTEVAGDALQELDGVDDDKQETPEIHSDTDTPDDITAAPDNTQSP